MISFITLTLIFTFVALSQTWSSSEKEVWQVVEKMYDHWYNGKIDGLLDLIHENFIGWRDNNNI